MHEHGGDSPYFSAIFIFTLSVLAALVSVTACQKPPANTIKIGIIASLTGGAADQGKNWLEGAQLAADQLKSEGLSLKLIVEDDATQPARVASAFLKLATVDRVSGIIGGTWDFLAETAYPLARQHRVPFLTPSNPPEVFPLAERDNLWIFTNSVSLEAEKSAVRKLFRHLGIKSVGLLIPNISYGHQHAAMMDDLVRESGLNITVREEFAMEGYPDNIKIGVLKFAKNPPDIIFVVLDANGIDLFTDEVQRLRLSPVILTTQHLGEAFTLSRDSGKYRRSYGVYPKVQAADFEARFESKFLRKPKVLAAEGYDALMFMVRAAQAGVSMGDPQSRFVYSGVMGEYKIPAPDKALVRSTATIMSTISGKFEELSLP